MARVTDEDIVAIKYDELMDKIEEVERRIFDKRFSSDPKTLYKKLFINKTAIDNLRDRGFIRADKYKQLFPPSGETDSKTLDIATMQALLRNFGGYKKPSNGWDKEPKKSDRSEIANLIRLKRRRNEGKAHLTKSLRTNYEFKKLYEKLKQPFLELGCSNQEIDDLVRFKIPVVYNFTPAVHEFIGRENDIEQIHIKMQGLEKSPGKMGLVVHGLKGIGKSQLSKKYFQEKRDYYNNNVVWINSDSLETSFQSLGELLKLKVKNDKEDWLSIETIIKDVHSYLADDKVLFIFDNADGVSCNQITKYLPTSKQNFSLITSQMPSEWPTSDFETIHLQPLAEEQVIQFVAQELNCIEESASSEVLHEIMKSLGGCLSSVKHFTTYINETGTSLEDYLVLINEQSIRPSLD